MQLTTAQKATLKAYIMSETDPTFASLRSEQATGAMAEWLNQPHASFIVWNSKSPIDDIYNAVTWKNFTPSDAVDLTALFTNRTLRAQTSLMSFQVLTKNGITQSIDATKVNVRDGIKDALQSLPTGAGGANQDAGWTAVKAALTRLCTRGEWAFKSGTGTSTTPGLLANEGLLSNEDVASMMPFV